jgi:hypothetical protein
MARRRKKARSTEPLIPSDAAWDPFRSDWLKLTPGQRLIRSWRLRKRIKDLEAAHDEKSLPRL